MYVKECANVKDKSYALNWIWTDTFKLPVPQPDIANMEIKLILTD